MRRATKGVGDCLRHWTEVREMIMDGGPCGMPDARHVPDIPRGGREEDKDHDAQIQPERGTTRVEGPLSIRAVHRF